MDSVALTVSSLVNTLEDVRPPTVRLSTFLKVVVVGVPLAVLVHDTADYWMPKSANIPILSWFRRRWARDPEVKYNDLATARKIIFFVLFLTLYSDTSVQRENTSSDYLRGRATSATARRSVAEDVHAARAKAFNAANEVLGEEELNAEAAQQQRDAALRRRYLHDSRLKH